MLTTDNNIPTPATVYRTREQRERDLVLAVGLFDLTDRDRRLLAWLSEWPQETTDAVADLFGRLIRPAQS